MKRPTNMLSVALVTVSVIFHGMVAGQTITQTPSFTKRTVAFVADERRSKHGDLYTPPAGKPGSWPGIVLVHDFRGVTQSIRSEAETLASHGYLVIVVDLYE